MKERNAKEKTATKKFKLIIVTTFVLYLLYDFIYIWTNECEWMSEWIVLCAWMNK